MGRLLTLPDGETLDLRYAVEWRPCLWLPPVRRVIEFFGDLLAKRYRYFVYEIFGRKMG